MKLTRKQTNQVYGVATLVEGRLRMNQETFFYAVNTALQLIEWNFCPKCGFRWERKGNYGCHGCGYLR